MKKVILILTMILSSIAISNAQKISMEKTFWGYRFIQGRKLLSMNELVSTMKDNPNSYKLIQSAKSNNIVAQVVGGIGGALVGYPIGTAIGGGKPNWTLAAIGAGVIGLSIPISLSVKKKTKQAIELYNSGLKTTTSSNLRPNFRIISNSNGLGLAMNF